MNLEPLSLLGRHSDVHLTKGEGVEVTRSFIENMSGAQKRKADKDFMQYTEVFVGEGSGELVSKSLTTSLEGDLVDQDSRPTGKEQNLNKAPDETTLR